MSLLTKTKLYTLLLLEPNKLFRQLVEESQSGVYLADEQGNLIYVNSAFSRMLGYTTKGELIGKNLAKELYVNPKEREDFLYVVEEKGSVRDYEVRNRRKDGSIATLSVTSNWVKDDADKIIGIEGIVHDITEKKKLEETFKDEKSKLTQILNFEESLSLIHDVIRLSDFAVEQISGILQAKKCSLMLYDKDTASLSIRAARGLDDLIIHSAHKSLGEAVAGIIAQKQKPVLVTNIEYDKDFQRANNPNYLTRSFMSTPILFGPQLLGVINVADKHSPTTVFTEIDLKMLVMMARAVSIALENANLFERLEDMAIGEPWSSWRHEYGHKI